MRVQPGGLFRFTQLHLHLPPPSDGWIMAIPYPERRMAESKMETKSASRPGGWPSRLPMHLRLRSALLEALLMMKENTTLKDGAICVQYRRDRVLESVCKC